MTNDYIFYYLLMRNFSQRLQHLTLQKENEKSIKERQKYPTSKKLYTAILKT